MRVALLSSTLFGRHCLQHGILPCAGVEVVGILTTPKRIEISYSDTPVEISRYCDFHDVSEKIGCEVGTLTGKVTGNSYLAFFHRWRPELVLALGWYYNVPRKARDVARIGCLGIHASLLPEYRGGAPVVWAIINGERRSGVTLFHLTDEIDAGDIVAQREFSIEDADTCATVFEKVNRASAEILRTSLPELAAGTARRIPQEPSTTVYAQRSPQDGLIDWSWHPKRIRDFIRAQTRPYPGAFFRIADKKVTIWDVAGIEIETVDS